jgi:hypothetical protein
MRFYIFILFSIIIISCQLDVDTNSDLEKVSIFDIKTPNNLALGEENPISFKYALKNGCYTSFDVEKVLSEDGKTLTITVYAEVIDSDVCTQVYSEETVSFTFKPTQIKSYKFKFWKKKNRFGKDEYTEVVINVTE